MEAETVEDCDLAFITHWRLATEHYEKLHSAMSQKIIFIVMSAAIVHLQSTCFRIHGLQCSPNISQLPETIGVYSYDYLHQEDLDLAQKCYKIKAMNWV
jgi:hypothetical protein